MQIMQISSLNMQHTKMYEAESNSTEIIVLGSINDLLINRTGISLPKVNCAISFFKIKGTGQDSLHYLALIWPTVQVLSTPWADSTVVTCRPWVIGHFTLGTTVFRNRITLGIHVGLHTPGTHSKLLYFKHKQSHDQSIWNYRQ